MDNLKNFFTSRSYHWIIWVIAEIIILAVVFSLGMRVGLHKARYSYNWGANYERNFVSPADRPMMGPGRPPMGPGGPMDFFRGLEERDFRNAHGLAGDIISISENTIIIKDRDNKENTVVANDKTIINFGRDNIKINNLTVGQRIVVIGKPDDKGVINAELIRVFNNNFNSQPQN